MEKVEIGSFEKVKQAGSPGAAALKDFMVGHGVIPAAPVSAAADAAPAVAAGASQENTGTTAAPTVVTESDFEKAIAAAARSSEATYEDRIKKFDLDKDGAAAIVDALLTKNYYEKLYPLTSKLSVTFRTRKVEDNDKCFEGLEQRHPEFTISINNHITKSNLAASLAAIGKTKFSADEKGYDQAMAFIKKLPGHVYVLLAEKLGKFDTMITTVLDAGAIENF